MKQSLSSSSITIDSSSVIHFNDLASSNSVMDPTRVNETLASFYKLGGDFNREEYRFLLQLMIKNCAFPLLYEMLAEKKVSHVLVRQLITSQFLYHLMLSKEYKGSLFRLLLAGKIEGKCVLPHGMFQSYLLPEQYIRFNEEGSVINQEGLFSYQDENGDTALHIAAQKKDVNSILGILFLSGKFDAPPANKDGENPLHIACRLGDFSTISLLLRYYPSLLEQKNVAEQLPYEVCPNYKYTLDKIIWHYISRILRLVDVFSGGQLDYVKLKSIFKSSNDAAVIQDEESEESLFSKLVQELISITNMLATKLRPDDCNKEQNKYRLPLLFLLIYSTYNLHGYYKCLETQLKVEDKKALASNMREWNDSVIVWMDGYQAGLAMSHIANFKFPAQISFETNFYFLYFMFYSENSDTVRFLDFYNERLYDDLKQILSDTEVLLKENIICQIPDFFLKLIIFKIEIRIQRGQAKGGSANKESKPLKFYYIGQKQFECYEVLNQLYKKYFPLENREELSWLYIHVLNKLWLEVDFVTSDAKFCARNSEVIAGNLQIVSRLLIRKKDYISQEEFDKLSEIDKTTLESIRKEVAKDYLSILNLKKFGKKYKLIKKWKAIESNFTFSFSLELSSDIKIEAIEKCLKAYSMKYSLENNLLIIHDPTYNKVETFMLVLFEVLKTSQTKKKILSYASSSSNPYAIQEEKIFQINTALEEKYLMFAKWQLAKRNQGAMIQLSDEDCSKIYIGLNKAGYQPERHKNQVIIPAIHHHLVNDLIKVLTSAISPEESPDKEERLLRKEEALPKKEAAGAVVVSCSSDEVVNKQSEETLPQKEEAEQASSTASQHENILNLPKPSFYPFDENYSSGNSEQSEDETDESAEGIDLNTFISKLKEACSPATKKKHKKQKRREKEEQEAQQEKLINEALATYKGYFFKPSHDCLATVSSEPTNVVPVIAAEENEPTAGFPDCSLGIAEPIVEAARPPNDASADKEADGPSSHNEKGKGKWRPNREQSSNQLAFFNQAYNENTFLAKIENGVPPSENFSSISEDDSALDSLAELTQEVFNFLNL